MCRRVKPGLLFQKERFYYITVHLALFCSWCIHGRRHHSCGGLVPPEAARSTSGTRVVDRHASTALHIKATIVLVERDGLRAKLTLCEVYGKCTVVQSSAIFEGGAFEACYGRGIPFSLQYFYECGRSSLTQKWSDCCSCCGNNQVFIHIPLDHEDCSSRPRFFCCRKIPWGDLIKVLITHYY